MVQKIACGLPKLVEHVVVEVVVNRRVSDLVGCFVNTRSNFQTAIAERIVHLFLGRESVEVRICPNWRCRSVDVVVGSLSVRMLASVENSTLVHKDPNMDERRNLSVDAVLRRNVLGSESAYEQRSKLARKVWNMDDCP